MLFDIQPDNGEASNCPLLEIYIIFMHFARPLQSELLRLSTIQAIVSLKVRYVVFDKGYYANRMYDRIDRTEGL